MIHPILEGTRELDKKEGDVAVLASLRVMRSLPSTSQEGSRSSIKYQFNVTFNFNNTNEGMFNKVMTTY